MAGHLIAKHPEHINATRVETPMHISTREGHADILALPLEHGADVDSRDGDSSIDFPALGRLPWNTGRWAISS